MTPKCVRVRFYGLLDMRDIVGTDARQVVAMIGAGPALDAGYLLLLVLPPLVLLLLMLREKPQHISRSDSGHGLI